MLIQQRPLEYWRALGLIRIYLRWFKIKSGHAIDQGLLRHFGPAFSGRDVWKNRERGEKEMLLPKGSVISTALTMLQKEILFIYIKNGISAHWILCSSNLNVCLYNHRCPHMHTNTENIFVAK